MENDAIDLPRKLGLKPELAAYTLHAPINYQQLLSWTTPLANINELGENLEWMQAFYKDKVNLEKEINILRDCLAKTGQLWISWPKKSSKIKSNLTDIVVREIGLAAGLVDVKVAAIDNTWSGLKFIYRLTDR